MRNALGSRASRVTLAFLITNALVVVVSVPKARAGPAEDDAAWTGACLLEGTADYGDASPAVPTAEQEVDIDLHGPCVTDAALPELGEGWLDVDLSTKGDTELFGCAGGVVSGSGTFSTDTPEATVPVDVTTVNVGGVLAMTVYTGGDTPNGVGVGAQFPLDTVDCLAGTMGGTATWTIAVVLALT